MKQNRGRYDYKRLHEYIKIKTNITKSYVKSRITEFK